LQQQSGNDRDANAVASRTLTIAKASGSNVRIAAAWSLGSAAAGWRWPPPVPGVGHRPCQFGVFRDVEDRQFRRDADDHVMPISAVMFRSTPVTHSPMNTAVVDSTMTG